jgi:hypothetical protein
VAPCLLCCIPSCLYIAVRHYCYAALFCLFYLLYYIALCRTQERHHQILQRDERSGEEDRAGKFTFFFAFFLFFRDKEERSGKYVAQASVAFFFFYTGPRRQDAAGEQLAIYVFSLYEYGLTKLK